MWLFHFCLDPPLKHSSTQQESRAGFHCGGELEVEKFKSGAYNPSSSHDIFLQDTEVHHVVDPFLFGSTAETFHHPLLPKLLDVVCSKQQRPYRWGYGCVQKSQGYL